MGLLLDQFRKKVEYDYGYGVPICIFDYANHNFGNNNFNTNNFSNNNISNFNNYKMSDFNNNNIKGPGFLGYENGCRVYALHKWNGKW